jgi:hypothetical protein
VTRTDGADARCLCEDTVFSLFALYIGGPLAYRVVVGVVVDCRMTAERRRGCVELLRTEREDFSRRLYWYVQLNCSKEWNEKQSWLCSS